MGKVQVYEFEEQNRDILIASMRALIDRADAEGLTSSMAITKRGDWYAARITVFPRAAQ